MADVYLVCEGPPDGLDVRVLNALLAQKLGAYVQIEPAGGDQNLAGVRAYIEARGRGIAFAIEDRNYRPREDSEATWTSKKRKLVWKRHEIENYLLEPPVVLAAFQSLRKSPRYAQAEALPSDQSAVALLLAGLARAALEAHAAQILRWELYVAATTGNPMGFRVPADAQRSWRRDEWLVALEREAARVRSASSGIADSAALAPSAIEARYDALLADLQRPEFVDDGSYLVDMAGKDLLETLAAQVPVPKDLLEDELVRVLPEVYEPDRLFHPDEFVLLKRRIDDLRAR